MNLFDTCFTVKTKNKSGGYEINITSVGLVGKASLPKITQEAIEAERELGGERYKSKTDTEIKNEIEDKICKAQAEQIVKHLCEGVSGDKELKISETRLLRSFLEDDARDKHRDYIKEALNKYKNDNPDKVKVANYWLEAVNTHADNLWWFIPKRVPGAEVASVPNDIYLDEDGKLKLNKDSDLPDEFAYLREYANLITNMGHAPKAFCQSMLKDLIKLLKDTSKRRHAIPVATLRALLVSFLNDKTNYPDKFELTEVHKYVLGCKTSKDRTTSVLAGVKTLLPIMIGRYENYLNLVNSSAEIDSQFYAEKSLSIFKMLNNDHYLDPGQLGQHERQIIMDTFDPVMFTRGNKNMSGIATNISSGVFESFFRKIKWLEDAMRDIKNLLSGVSA